MRWFSATGAVAAIALAGAQPAFAEDVLLDLSTPEQVQAALQDAGYKATLKKTMMGRIIF